MVESFIHWNINPVIFQLGSHEIRWYGLLFAGGFFFGYLIMGKFFKIEKVPEILLDKITLYTAVGTILGARLGHCLFYEPAYYLSNPLEIIKVWHGGLASHGAAVGILLALWIFSKKVHKPFLWTMDRVVVVVALAGFLIRMGNLMNSEIYGVETSLPWGFIFENRGEIVPKHPTQVYEGLSYLLIFILLYWIYMKNKGKVLNGLLFSLFLILVFTARFIIEFIKEPQVGFEENMSLNMGQLLSIPLVVAGFLILFLIFRKRNLARKS